jgi:hypothetical protein
MKPHRMMSCSAYINNDRQTQQTLLCLKVNERVVYNSDEDEAGHSANPVLDVTWEDDKTELLIRAKFATITLGSCSFTTATSEVPACAYGIPILLKDGVFLAMRQSSHTNVVQQLERLHFATLQKFCLRGPDPPFDKLRVARNEWYDAYASGTGCRAVMINRIKRLHLAREIEKSAAPLQLDKANTRSIFFVAALVDDLQVNSIVLGVVDQEAKEFALSGRTSGKKYTCGVFHIPWCSSSPFRVTIQLGNIRHTIDVPALCEPFALGNDGAIIFFAGDELPPVSSWLQNVDHAESRQNVTDMASTIANETSCYVLDVTSLPKLGAVVVPLSLASRSGVVRYFNVNDVTWPVLQDCGSMETDTRALGFTASSRWQPPSENDRREVEMTYTYMKVDSRKADPAHRLTLKDVKIETKTFTMAQGDVGREIPLSSTSTLKISMVSGRTLNSNEMMKYRSCEFLRKTNNQDPFLSRINGPNLSKSLILKWIALRDKLDRFASNLASSCRVNRPQAQPSLSGYLQGLCKLSAKGLQDRCASPSPEDCHYLSLSCWRDCWTYGSGARIAMLRRIANCFLFAGHVHPFLSYISSNPEARNIYVCLDQLSDSHHETLQKQCRDGGTYIRGTEVLKMSKPEWRSCLRDGKGCRDAMAAAAAECVDRRVLLGLRLEGSKPTGMLDYDVPDPGVMHQPY